MPVINQQRHLAWSAQEMYDLVADVKRYPEFLPWVVATRIKSDSETEMVADMMVGFSALREKFTSRVHKDRPRRIAVEYLDGPLKRLSNTWVFADAEDGGCVIDFNVDFTFRSAIFEALAGQYLDRAFRKMVAAFETRAEKLYGSKSSSATSAA
ncbi:type II toxin-antitoxin system RatA family toxin [Novosphingobium sp. PASSN1]|uniref:type II toxin-antitoxin system RatA family toxin n=1 Tax=Novosphingobium sp. PASSN1 TaxID=2015561 RepID=UPI000BC8B414|nr:type II toxin-antitoxin system RatA family toxin [Novosphingobium sp. PASSN1]OYU37262.1 MAG: ubiquinone-binding protein [Novosphingobium sp. PASSN1]